MVAAVKYLEIPRRHRTSVFLRTTGILQFTRAPLHHFPPTSQISTHMTFSPRIRTELFNASSDKKSQTPGENPQLIRLPLTRPASETKNHKKKIKINQTSPLPIQDRPERHGLPWTTEEHDRFLRGLEEFPCGPWKSVAAVVGTRSPRQTMTHAQKYRQKIQRRRRELLTSSKRPVHTTSDIYGGIVVTTKAAGSLPQFVVEANPSPTIQDTPPRSRPVPDILALDNMSMTAVGSAFRAFLQDSDPKLFSTDTNAVDPKTFCTLHEDGTSIVL